VPTVKRYDPTTITIHWMAFVSLLGLSVTGILTAFTKNLPGLPFFSDVLGGVDVAQQFHRIFAALLIVTVIFWILAVIVGIIKYGWSNALVFTPKEIQDIFRSIRAVLSGGRTEPTGKFHWGQKLFFWQIVVGTAVLGITGLDMMGALNLSPFSYGINLLLHDVFFWVVFAGCILHVWAVLFVGNEKDFSAIFTGYIDADFAAKKYPNWKPTKQEKG